MFGSLLYFIAAVLIVLAVAAFLGFHLVAVAAVPLLVVGVICALGAYFLAGHRRI
jgi:hypothetical protein